MPPPLLSRFRVPALSAGLVLLLLSGTSDAAGAPRRIVSVNLCADQLVMLLADRGRIASLSVLAASPELSFVAGGIAGIPLNTGMAEDVVPLEPDLVLAGRYTARPAVEFLRAKGVPVIELDIPQDFDGIRAQLRRVAAALGEEARGEALLAAMDRTLAAVPPPLPGERRPVAMTWQAGGFTAGAGTLVDAVLAAAGIDNLATRRGLTGYGYLSLEAVVAGHPDLLVAEAALPGRPSLRQALLQHPALAHAGAIGRRVAIPAALTACGGPFTAEAVRLLRAAVTP